jgi:2-dehydropantoate 2-reductase
MKIGIVGAGAVGGYLACMLARTGHDIAVLARGPRAATIRDHGIALSRKDGGHCQVRPRVVEHPSQLDGCETTFVCLKAYSVAKVAPALASLCHDESRIVFVQNGLPWWYFAGAGGSELLDPGGRIAAAIPLRHVTGCVTYVNVRNAGPGRAEHVGDDTFVLGRPDGAIDKPLERLVAAMVEAGIAARATGALRREIWIKLWGNIAFNPISALTAATMDRVIAEATTRPIVIAMMEEARAVAAKGGIDFGMSIEQRLEIAARAGAFKTSMLQDVEAGRRLEIDAIIGAVAEHGRRVGIATPTIDVVLGLIRQKGQVPA